VPHISFLPAVLRCGEIATVENSVSSCWLALDSHFDRHAQQVARFRGANRRDVRRMWKAQTNEHGEPLSIFERKALIERHCELFGTWPQSAEHRRRQIAADRGVGHRLATFGQSFSP
jgi:hypothetical protein